jgi:hypothetical protein
LGEWWGRAQGSAGRVDGGVVAGGVVERVGEWRKRGWESDGGVVGEWWGSGGRGGGGIVGEGVGE